VAPQGTCTEAGVPSSGSLMHVHWSRNSIKWLPNAHALKQPLSLLGCLPLYTGGHDVDVPSNVDVLSDVDVLRWPRCGCAQVAAMWMCSARRQAKAGAFPSFCSVSKKQDLSLRMFRCVAGWLVRCQLNWQ